MNFTIIIRVMIEILAANSTEISSNDIKKDVHGLDTSANISETTNDVSADIEKSTSKPKLNHNCTETNDCVNSTDNKIEDTNCNNKDDKKLIKLVTSENNECSNMNLKDELENKGEVFKPKDTSNFDQECKLHLDEDVDIMKYVLITPTGNAKNLNQSSDCVETIKKVGFSTDEILDFIKTKREKIINSDECMPSDQEISEFFNCLATQCKIYSNRRTPEEIRILLFKDYIKARKERMLFYNTYEIFENEINFIIETSEKLPCSDNIARDIKVAKNIISFIQAKTSSCVEKNSYIVSEQDLWLYLMFDRSLMERLNKTTQNARVLKNDVDFLKQCIKYELNDFNTYIPSDREIESFISTKVASMDNSGDRTQTASKKLSEVQRERFSEAIAARWLNLGRL